MTGPNRNRTDRFVDTLFKLLADIEPESPEDVRAAIESVGIDPDDYARKIEKLAADTLKNQTRNEIEAARRQYDMQKSKRRRSRSTIVERIEEVFRLYPGIKQRLGLAYRNLGTTSDEDLQSLLDDLEYLVASEDSSGSE